ncbi:MAG: HPr-rel-A system PqqD family peptide chaperone [Ilumatobacteraceae bacterium]
MTDPRLAMPHRVDMPTAVFDDAYVVLDAVTAETHLLETTTAVVFDACDGVTTSAELIDDFVVGLGVEPATAVALIEESLASLSDLGLLRGTERQAPPPCIGCRDPLLDEPVRRRRKSAGLEMLGSYSAHGVRFRLESTGDLGAALRDAFEDLAAPTRRGEIALRVRPTSEGLFDVEWGDRLQARGIDEANALAQALISVNYAAAAASVAAGDAVLHAGAIAIGGQGVAFAGSSGVGKTTLVAGAAQRGYGVIAEEVCAIDAFGAVRPYHRPLGLRAAGAAALGLTPPAEGRYEHVWPVSARRWAPLSQGAPLRLVLVSNYRPGPPEIERWSPARSHAALVGCGLGVDAGGALAEPAFRRFEQLARTVPVYRLDYDDIDIALVIVNDLIEDALAN